MTDQARNLAALDAALRGVHVSEAERAALHWLAGQDGAQVANLARVFNRARAARSITHDSAVGRAVG